MKSTAARTARLAASVLGGLLISSVGLRAAPPVIESFTSPDSVIRPEGAARLQWTVSGAVSATITPNIGSVPVPTGKASDTPEDTTTYTLRATNPEGSVTATVKVEIPQPIGVSATGAWTVRQSFANVTNAGLVDSLTKADQILNAPTGSPLIRQNHSAANNVAFIDYSDSAAGVFGFNRVPPGGGASDNFTIRARANLVVNETGTYTFAINNDDGGRLLIDLNKDGDFYLNPAVNIHNASSNIYDTGEAVIIDNALHGPTTTTADVALTPGTYAIEYTFFEQAGGMSGEAFYLLNGDPVLLGVTPVSPPTVTPDLIISEFVTDNQTGLRDADGSREDWIEIFNGTPNPVALENYWLTDDAALPNKWRFPAAVLPAGGYRVVFASDKNTTLAGGEFHTNFKLSQSGEHLGLYKSDGAGGYTMVSGWLPTYPAQYSDRSYGRYDTELYTGFFITQTPGKANNGGYDGFTPDVKFSVDRGVYSSPQSLLLNIDSAEPNPGLFQIRYTVNGSEPTITNGTVYTPGTPVAITKTTALRAAAVRANWKSLDVDTHTYLFPDDVVTQNTSTASALGFPVSSVNSQVYRYGMNTTLVNSQRAAVKAALTAIPSISIVVPQVDFSAAGTGIYSNSRTRGVEVKASVEMLNEDGKGTGQFQIDCGLRVRGGFSRDPSNPKHAFRLLFKNIYDGALEYPVFQGEGASHFERLDLRTSQNYSWAFQNDNKNTFIREELSRDLQGATGQPYSRCRYLHLYINGIYWGLYDTDERFEENFGEAYLGGSEDNYDVVKSSGSEAGYLTEATQGALQTLPIGTPPRPGDAAWSTTVSAWRVLWEKVRSARTNTAQANNVFFEIQGLQPDGKTSNGKPPLLDVDNLIDYMLLSWYCGSFDAPLSIPLNNASNNWFGMRNPETGRGFIFAAHDFEHGMAADHTWASFDRIGPWGGSGQAVNRYNSLPSTDPLYVFRKQASWQTQYNTVGDFTRSNPAYLHEDLAFGSSEYRVRMWDRAHRHFFNGGAMTEAKVLEKIAARRATVDSAILAEQARWGNTSSLTRAAWVTEVNYLIAFFTRGSAPSQPLTANANVGRANTMVTLMRGYMDGGAKPLYPAIEAPAFSLGGGAVTPGAELTMSIPGANTPAGTIYFTQNGADPRAVGGAINTAGGAQTYSAAVALNQTTTVKARVWNGTTWSALMESTFLTAAPASAANLVISELNYHPAGGEPGTAADAQLYEFVELQNVSAAAVDLTGVTFVEGITFAFPEGLQLPAGARVVVVRDQAAFQSRYPDAGYPGLSAKIAGVFADSFSAAGERVLLRARDGSVISDLTYRDSTPWPVTPDGAGPTLVFTTLAPQTAAEGDPLNWSAHALPHGNPGGPDSIGFTGWTSAFGVAPNANDDSDSDGLANLLEYALAGDPTSRDSAPFPESSVEEMEVRGVIGWYQTFSFTRAEQAADARTAVEYSTTLDGPWSEGAVLLDRAQNGDGTETLLYRAPLSLSAAPRLFMRLRATGG